MKNLIVFVAFLLLCAAPGFTQSSTKIGKVGFTFTPMFESYGVSSFDNILDLAKNKEEVIRDLSDFNGQYTAHIGGVYAGLQFMITPKKANRALLINTSIALGKEMFVSSYNNINFVTSNQVASESDGLVPIINDEPFATIPQEEEAAYCVVENEFRIDATWVHYKNLGHRWTLYGGFGGALGATYNNDFIVMGTEKIDDAAEDEPQFRELNETYESRNSLLGRVHAYGGVGFRITKHYEIAFEGKQGVGLQKAIGGPADFIRSSGIYGFSIRYVL